MNINVETKFNIGDMVYCPEPYWWWIPNTEPMQIVSIDIQYRTIAKIIILYSLSDGCTYPEELCFVSREECKQWCNAKNSEE